MQGGHEAATDRWTSLSLAGALLSGLLVSLLSVVLMISVAGMIFSGDLAPFLRQGIGLSLFGGLVLGVAGAFGASFRGTICHPQDVTGVILALAAAAIAGRVAEPGAVYATVAILIALASVVTGVAFLLAMFFAPLVNIVPSEAATPALVFVGFLMMSQVSKIDFNDIEEGFPAFLTLALMPFTFSITIGIGAGFISWVVLKVALGKASRVHPLMYAVAAAFVVYFASGVLNLLAR